MRSNPFHLSYLAIALALLGCSVMANGPAKAPTGPKPGEPLSRAPLHYFSQHCANCHGDMGEMFGPQFATGYTEAELQKMVKKMADLNANAPLSGADLAAQVEFLKALSARRPFVAWTSSAKGVLSGEAMPGTKLSATAGGKSVPVTQKGWTWSVQAHPPVTVTATHGKTSVKLEIPKRAFTPGQ